MAHTLPHFIDQARAQVPGAAISPNQVGNRIEYRVLGHPDLGTFTQPTSQIGSPNHPEQAQGHTGHGGPTPSTPAQALQGLPPSQQDKERKGLFKDLGKSTLVAVIAGALAGGIL